MMALTVSAGASGPFIHELTVPAMIRTVTFTTLYPNAVTPTFGVFVENRLRHLLATGEVETRVVAPVPYFPFTNPIFGQYSQFARVPAAETRHGLAVTHPRYPVIPKVGMSVGPALLHRGARASLRRLLAEGFDFDLIDAHYVYPDGVAAARLARELGKPFVVTARGTDMNLIADFPGPRRQIREALAQAAAIITVSDALGERVRNLGIEDVPVVTLRNGVDLDAFRETDRETARTALALSGPTLISVGHLVENKGHHLVIEALADLPDVALLICGTGPMEKQLKETAQRLGVAGRVRFLGAVSHDELARYYSAADLLVLASAREGMPNVVLEALACGTPVVATNVGGIPEIITAPPAGRLVEERSSSAIADAVRQMLGALPQRAETRTYAEAFSWDRTSRGLLDLFRKVVHAQPAGRQTARAS